LRQVIIKGFFSYLYSVYSFNIEIFCPKCTSIHEKIKVDVRDDKNYKTERNMNKKETDTTIITVDELIMDVTTMVSPSPAGLSLLKDYFFEIEEKWQ